MKIVLLGTFFLYSSVYTSNRLDALEFKKKIEDVGVRQFIISFNTYKDLYCKLIKAQNILEDKSQHNFKKEQLHVCIKPNGWSQCSPKDEDTWIDYNVMTHAANLISEGKSIYNYTLCSCGFYQPTWDLLYKESYKDTLKRKQKNEPMPLPYENAKKFCSVSQPESANYHPTIEFSKGGNKFTVSKENIALFSSIPKIRLNPLIILHGGTPQ